MNVNGVLASLNFPSWPGLGGQFFVQNDDTRVRRGDDPRLQRLAHPRVVRRLPGPLHPARALAASCSAPTGWPSEIRRVAELGCHAVSFHSEPHRFGIARHPRSTSGTRRGRRASDIGTVAVFHFGGFPNFMPRTPFSVIPHSMPFQTAIFAAELLWSPIMQKFPKIKMALAEGGIGWVPYFLEKADFVYDHHRGVDRRRLRRQAPEPGVPRARADVLHRRRAPACATATQIGVDTITWECDYPHSDSHVAGVARGADEVAGGGRPPRRRDRTRSRGRTPAAGTSSTRSSTAPARSAPWVRCGRRPPTSTPRPGVRRARALARPRAEHDPVPARHAHRDRARRQRPVVAGRWNGSRIDASS